MALSDNCEAFWSFATSSLTDAKNGHVLTSLNTSFESSAPGPCRKADVSGNSILRCSTITLTEPFTMAAEIYVDGGASGDFTFLAYARGSADYLQAYQSASNILLVRSRSGGTAGDADGGGVTGSAWNDVAGVWTSSTSRQAYRDGTLSAANTTSVSPSGAGTTVSALAIWDGSAALNGSFQNWRIRNWAIWSRGLSDAELDSYHASPTDVLIGGGGSTLLRKLNHFLRA